MKKEVSTFLSQLRAAAWTLLLAAAVLLVGATACSDDDVAANEGGGDNPAVVDKDDTELMSSPLQVTTDPASMPIELFNYAASDAASRSGEDDDPGYFEMPAAPEVPSDAAEYDNENVTGTAKVSSNRELQFNGANRTIYVCNNATWTIPSGYGAGTIYVMSGSTIKVNNLGGLGDVKIYNYGTIEGYDTLNEKGETVTPYLGVGEIWSNGPIKADNTTLNIECTLKTKGAITAKAIEFKCNALSIVDCKIEANDYIYFTNTAAMYVGYIKAPNIKLDSNATVYLKDGGYMAATEGLLISNTKNQWGGCSIYGEDENCNALIEAGKITINQSWQPDVSATFKFVSIACTNWYCNDVNSTALNTDKNDNYTITFDASVKCNGDISVTKKEQNDTCAPVLVTDGSDDGSGNDGKVEPKLETIAFQKVVEHTHPISATCVQFDNTTNKAYVSWHEKGKGIHGCIEVFTVDKQSNTVTLNAWAEDESVDFNHLIVDEYPAGTKRILAVGHDDETSYAGHSDTTAIIGSVKLDANGLFTTGTDLRFTTLRGKSIQGEANPEFYGGDGNCIVRNGNYLSVATYGGFITLNPDLSRYQRYDCSIATPGSGKHVALSADGTKLAVLNLIGQGTERESSPANLRVFAATDYTWSSTPSLDVTGDLTISPVDGKNVIAFDPDGSAIYVCTGFYGLRKYDSTTGNLLDVILNDGSPVNGMCVDQKYLYIACGKGLVIYDKTNLNRPVYFYRHSRPSVTNTEGVLASCNYVAVDSHDTDNVIIYLAYGRDGIEVLRMHNY